MKSIWAIEIEMKPAGPLTFRQMPSGLLHIMSYPFMPPTTMSGFLRRLLDIAEGGEWAGYGDDWFGKGPGKCFTLTLDSDCRALGAFPRPKEWVIHKTRRHGPKNFKHAEFSQLLRTAHKENYELHHWDYLFCETLTGWVAAKEKAPLERFRSLKNFGGKAGKEGYVVISRVGAPRRLEPAEGHFTPLGLVTAPLRPITGRFFNLYGHWWDESYEWQNGEKGGVSGFTQLGAWWEAEGLIGPYWAWADGIGFSATMPDDFLQGEREPFYTA
ncbi:MAG: hypothetical protein RBT16_08060 [Desulfococcus multivorans]|jgi:hypothetical protein|nr:hypothetical protein [Desulfococcus multivorans]